MGSVVSIDVSLSNIWRSWYTFVRGKKRNRDLDIFTYSLEENLLQLSHDLSTGNYRHGPYRSFLITDTKQRVISVASLRDRVVHRLLYTYLLQIFDHTFIYDAWSCRTGKGLLGAITRTEALLDTYRYAYVWRGDITKFFDSVDQQTLKSKIRQRVHDSYALQLIDTVIGSFSKYVPGTGIPIGNLTSQVFTNIYLGEFDRYILHTIKPLAYVRYGDDFLVIMNSRNHLELCREHLIVYLDQILKLTIHAKNNIIVPTGQGVHFLGCDIYPTGRRIQKKMYERITRRINFSNSSSYRGLLLAHSKQNIVKWIDYNIVEMLDQI